MKRFHFSLQKILDLRLKEEREWELRLAAADGECRRVGNEINGAREKRRSLLVESHGQDPSQWLLYEKYRQHLAGKEVVWEKELEKLLEKKEEVRKGYTEALKRRKVLDKLREKREAEYRLHQNRRENMIQDELGSRMRWEEEEVEIPAEVALHG